jgi:hypothetical protein
VDNSKLGLRIVAILAIVGILGSFLLFTNDGKLKFDNALLGKVLENDIQSQESFAVNSLGNQIYASTAESSLGCTWTTWKNRDTPSGVGDYETLVDFTGVCQNPSAIDCTTVNDVDYTQTGQKVVCSTNVGLTCKNSENPTQCKDYKVRFCCPNTSLLKNSTTTTTSNVMCYDSDGGLFYSKKGFINATNTSVRYDYCLYDNRTLVEYFCSNSTTASKQYVCPYTCRYGACVETQNINCTDTDGNNIYTFGSASGILQETGDYKTIQDRCVSNTTALESYCDYSGKYLYQTFAICPAGCDLQKGACKSGGSECAQCIYGCSDGQCLSAPSASFVTLTTNQSTIWNGVTITASRIASNSIIASVGGTLATVYVGSPRSVNGVVISVSSIQLKNGIPYSATMTFSSLVIV